jgi:hypothetical protein
MCPKRVRVICAVNVAEVVGAGSVVLEVGSEERFSQRALDSVKPGPLLRGTNGVDGAHGEAEESIGVDVLREQGRDGSGSLDSLRSGSNGTNSDLVSVDLATGTRAVAVQDLPGVAGLSLRGIYCVVVMARER